MDGALLEAEPGPGEDAQPAGGILAEPQVPAGWPPQLPGDPFGLLALLDDCQVGLERSDQRILLAKSALAIPGEKFHLSYYN